jgi:transposase
MLDYLSIHLGARVQQAIEAVGCRLLFLPAYSPDLSPIEDAFSKVKMLLRRAKLAAEKPFKRPLPRR